MSARTIKKLATSMSSSHGHVLRGGIFAWPLPCEVLGLPTSGGVSVRCVGVMVTSAGLGPRCALIVRLLRWVMKQQIVWGTALVDRKPTDCKRAARLSPWLRLAGRDDESSEGS